MLVSSYNDNVNNTSLLCTPSCNQIYYSQDVSNIRELQNSSPYNTDKGIFSDILSDTGNVLGTVTVDTVHSLTTCNITDTQIDDLSDVEDDSSYTDGVTPKSISGTLRTETYTNEDVLRIKLTPTLMEFDEYLYGRHTPHKYPSVPQYLAPIVDSQDAFCESISQRTTPEPFCNFQQNFSEGIVYKSHITVEESSVPLLDISTDHSTEQTITTPLDNITENIEDNYCDISVVNVVHDIPIQVVGDTCDGSLVINNDDNNNVIDADIDINDSNNNKIVNPPNQIGDDEQQSRSINEFKTSDEKRISNDDLMPKQDNVQHSQCKLNQLYLTISNIPAHYHAAIICFMLIAYNVINNFYKQHYDNA